MSELKTYMIDTVRAASDEEGKAQVQFVTLKVLASDAEHAIQRFIEEEAGVEFYAGDLSDAAIVGIQEVPGEIIEV